MVILFQTFLFYSFAALLVGAALGVIFSRNPVHSVMFLVFAFFQSAILWLLIEAEFLALVLVLVYVGAVMVLFLFVVMMLDVDVEEVGEEGVELALAAAAGDRDEVIDEAADLLYHMMVLLADQELGLKDVCDRLRTRHSGG